MSSWPDHQPQVKRLVLSSLTSEREQGLDLIRTSLPASDAAGVLPLLLSTYNYYLDPHSRHQLVTTLDAIVAHDASHVKAIFAYVADVGKANLAVTSLLTLLSWVNHFMAGAAADGELMTVALSSQAELVENIVSHCHGQSQKHLARIKSSAVHSSQMAIAGAMSRNPQLLDNVALASMTPSVGLCFLGLLAKAPANSISSEYITKAGDWYGAQVLLSKNAVPTPSLELFGEFVSAYVSSDVFVASILPSAEKAVLRSSELSWGTNLPPLFASCDFDMSVVLTSKLFASMLTALKSPKPTVVAGATEAATQVVQKTQDEKVKLIDEIAKTLKATSNVEAKRTIANLFTLIDAHTPEIATHLLDTLTPIIAKEANEVSLEPLVRSFCKLATPEAKYVAVVAKGLDDKKPQIKRVWLLAITQAAPEVVDQVKPQLSAVVDAAIDTPMPMVASKLMVGAYVALAITDYNPPKAFGLLVNSDVYTKLSGDDLGPYINALHRASAVQDDDEARAKYADAWLWVMTSPQVSYATRLQAVKVAKQVANAQPWFGLAVVDALKRSLHTEKPPVVEKSVPAVLAMLTQLDDAEQVKQNALALVVVANHAKVPVNNGWIGLLQRSHGANDIAKLVLDNYQQLVSQLCDEVFADSDAAWHEALVSTIALLGFILPEPVVPELLTKIKHVYTECYGKLMAIDDEKIAIWQHQGVEPYVNVLAKGKPEDKNSKDYETRKWEESLKKDLKKKPTLTREQQAQVKAQLEVEQGIRSEIDTWVYKLRSVVAIFAALTNTAKLNVDNATAYWFPDAVIKLLELAKSSHSTTVFNSQVTDTFLQLSELCTPKLAAIRKMLGVATLRTLKIAVDPAYAAEPLLALVGRLLYRIKMVSDSQPLDSTTLTYCMPLLVQVLKIGYHKTVANASQKKVVTSEFVDEDPEEEHLLLALEIISNHASQFASAAHAKVMPRTPILEVVVALMKLPSRAKSAKETLTSLCHYIGISPLPEDLHLLLGAVIVPEVYVKHAVLEAIDAEFDLHAEGLTFSPEVWIAVHDNDDAVAETAATVWQDSQFSLPDDALEQLLQFFGASDAGMRYCVARSYVNAVAGLKQPERAVELLLNHLRANRDPPPPKKDAFGLVIKSSESSKDPWEQRHTVALALKMMADQVKPESMPTIFEFMINEASLGDRHDEVRAELLNAAVDLITAQGAQVVDELSPIIEACLNSADAGSKAQDTLKESAIVCYGALAQHLEGAALFGVIDQLVVSLATPSEDVQVAIGKGIAPLVAKMGSKFSDYLDNLLQQLLDETKSMPVRRGSAYGMAGLVHGYGIKALAEYDIVRQLLDASDDKKVAERRESVAFAFECLSHALGKFFEPYVISEVLPVLLKQLGDMSPEVREATDYAARQIMKNTTSFGVKKLIPVAIRNLDEIAWRSKKGSVELLGNMAYLDPAQLSASLSLIIPEIVGVLNDTHKEVRKAADASLKKFGEVIRNPEIQAIVPSLIDAIGDPTKHTDTALDQLIHTQFVHYIDGPSLALIIHVIHRGMRDRSAAVKKKACQIVGNMAILVDAKDLEPYLGQLVSELEVAMVDPVPATRSTAARALGSLVEKLGEQQFPELIPSLLATLNDPERAGDRLGSAQALAEVICGLGIGKLEEMLPTVLSGASSSSSAVRAGYMPLLLYLPVCFGSSFAPYLNQTIPPILSGLADTDADVSDTALRAGRLIVNNYAKKAVDLLLPELERGLGDDNYRIRLSSVELTGDLLFQIAGISGKTDTAGGDHDNEDDDEVAVESASSGEVAQALIDTLGQQRRDHVLASLFLCRSDVAGIVRAAAIDIWNALVGNTPKTVKQILPTLISIIVVRLASADDTHRKIAATCLGDTVRRVGANALAQMLPTLRANLDGATDSDAKQGICIATTELIRSASDEALRQYQPVFVDIVRQAVVDDAPQVRAEAAVAFEALVDALGKEAIDEIVPNLLSLMAGSQRTQALAGLRDLMTAQAETIFPILLPTLLSPPMDSFKAQALAQLCSVAGSALSRRLGAIVSTLVEALVATPDDTEVASALDAVLVAVDDDGCHALLQQILSLVKHEDAATRAAIYARLGGFFAHTSLDYSMYLNELVSQFVLSLGDRDPVVVQGTFDALSALVKAQPKEQLEKLVRPAAQALEMSGVRDCDLAGFALPKGPQCVLPIFSHGLMYGSSELKEVAANAIGDVIGKTPAANLKPFATTITGPLIRVIGEKVGAPVKSAILHALNALLQKIPQFLRPFVPQLQRTFVRSLGDSSSDELRKRAVACLATLIKFQPRVDALVSELVAGTTSATDAGVKTAMLQAMLAVVDQGGAAMSEQSKAQVLQLAQQEIGGANNESAAVAYAELMGAIAKVVSAEEAAHILRSKVLDNSEVKDKFGVLTVNSFLRYAPAHIFGDASLLAQIVDYVTAASMDANAEISENGTVAMGKLLLGGELGEANEAKVMETLATVTVAPPSSSTSTRRLALVVVRTVARINNAVVARHLDIIVPSVFASLRDRIIPIKLAAEKAYLAVFNLVEDEQGQMFDQWFTGKDKIVTITGTEIIPRSVGDYTKRVASRLATAEREKISAGGDAEEMFSDQFEDEKEVWKVGV